MDLEAAALEEGIDWLLMKNNESGYPFGDNFFRLLRDPSISNQPKKYRRAREKLLRLTLGHFEAHGNVVPKDVHRWNPLEFPGYPEVEMFLATHLSQRYQFYNGNCFMHAPATVQHYAIAHALSRQLAPMVDLVHFAREHMPLAWLSSCLHEDSGGTSLDMLQMLLKPGSVLEPAYPPWLGIEALLQQHGPALVSQFKVHRDFMDESLHHHTGKVKGEKLEGSHAMCLLGVRREGTKLFFLLQNWWKGKQFVELDESYLSSSGVVVVYFVKTPQTEIPQSFASDMSIYHESGLDCAEGFILERVSHL